MTTKVAEGVRQEDLFINGKSLPSLSKKTFDDFNPTTGELFAQVAEGGAEDAEAAIEAAEAATAKWQSIPATGREKIL